MPFEPPRSPLVATLFALVVFASAAPLPAQVAAGAWVYPSSSGNLLYQLDERGQRIPDFSDCGYRGGTEPLPDAAALIAPDRWLRVEPGDGDDTSRIQAAIDAVAARTPDAAGWRGVVHLAAGEFQLGSGISITSGGIILKGSGAGPDTGTRLRATAATQYTLIEVTGSGSRSTVSGTTRNFVQPLVPAGARTFQVDSVSGLAVGHTVIVRRPSTTSWIAELGTDQLGPASGGTVEDTPWTAGSKNLSFDRVITRIDGTWITVDAPLPQTFESRHGGGQLWRYTWTGRIRQVGIEDLYGISDYAAPDDEAHAWTFINLANLEHAWVRRITARHFGYAAVRAGGGAKWLTVADSQCLDPVSVITGSRRYSFDNEGAELTLFINNYARGGRHDYVLGSLVPGPNAFVFCRADSAHSDIGPHHRWSVGGLFDNVTSTANEINVQNRGNSGTGHGWAGAYMTVWNCAAVSFRVRNPPTARNWLVGSAGALLPSIAPVGADPAGTVDGSGPAAKSVYPKSLYHGQLQQRLRRPGSEFREVWLGDIDQHADPGGAGEAVAVQPAWLAAVQALDATPAAARFDHLGGTGRVAFSCEFPLEAGSSVVAASLTVSLRATGPASATSALYLDSTASPLAFAGLGWTPIDPESPSVRTVEVDPALLADGRLNVALGPDCAVDFAVLHLQVQKAQPASHTVSLPPEADAYVRGGTANATVNFGSATTLPTKDVSVSSVTREAFLRWDLAGRNGILRSARVRLAGTAASQPGNENAAALVADSSWNESTLTFATKPAASTPFAQWLPVTGQPVEFDVTAAATTALATDGRLSLRIASTGDYGPAGNVTYASRENTVAANRPQLLLTFDGTLETIADWRQSRFGTSADSGPAATSADPDGDGLPNADEYILGTDPLLPDFAPFVSVTPLDDRLHFSFLARAASGPGYLGRHRRFSVETATDLASPDAWTTLPAYFDIPATDQLISGDLAFSPPRLFLRLRVALD